LDETELIHMVTAWLRWFGHYQRMYGQPAAK